MNLTDRKKAILAATVESHIKTAEPVGSKMLSADFGCSSATIRQELAELERDGLLMHPHTSSGRVPTDLGYRLYVDSLMKRGQLSVKERQILQQTVGAVGQNLSDAFAQVSQILSSLIDYTVIVLTPDVFIETLKLVHLVMVDLDRILVVLLHSAGVNQEFLLNISSESLSQDDFNKISKLLTEKLEGKPLSQLDQETLDYFIQVLPEYERVLGLIVSELKQLTLSQQRHRKLVMGGTSKMLKLPEFQNIEFAQKVLSTLEEDKVLLSLLMHYREQDVPRVVIGAETQVDTLNDCSLVVSQLQTGAVGILGPKRMPYATIVPMLDTVTKLMRSYGHV